MPRFFFDVYDGAAVPDSQGQECADLADARRLASRFAGDLLRDAPDRLWRDGDWTIWVRDEQGLRLFSVVVIGTLAPAGRGVIWHDSYAPAWKG